MAERAPTSLSSSQIEALRRAVEGEPGDDVEMLIWRAGDLRRRTEDAHHRLDMLDAPRKQGDGVLTIAGRLEALRP